MWDFQSARRLWLVLDTAHFHRSVGCSQEGTRQCYDAHFCDPPCNFPYNIMGVRPPVHGVRPSHWIARGIFCEYVQQPQVIDRKVSNLQNVRYCHEILSVTFYNIVGALFYLFLGSHIQYIIFVSCTGSATGVTTPTMLVIQFTCGDRKKCRDEQVVSMMSQRRSIAYFRTRVWKLDNFYSMIRQYIV